MEFVSEDILVEFQLITNVDISVFFEDYFNFTETHYNNIVNFYSGKSDVSNQAAFSELDRLQEVAKEIIQLFDLNAKRFTTYDAWILLEQVENVKEALLTIDNLPKYLRSTIDQSSYNNSVKIDYVAGQGQTLESVEADISASDDPDQWVDLALRNNLKEEDYSPAGGFIIGIQLNNQFEFSLNTVVKGIESVDDTYGLDLDKTITLVDDDLKVLTPKETIEQSAFILINLQKGDNPTHISDGIDKKLVAGRNVMSVAYPILFRQIANTISTDDSFKSMAITDIRNESDATFVDIELNTQAGDFNVQETLTLS